jgi:hypothetical protein
MVNGFTLPLDGATDVSAVDVHMMVLGENHKAQCTYVQASMYDA